MEAVVTGATPRGLVGKDVEEDHLSDDAYLAAEAAAEGGEAVVRRRMTGITKAHRLAVVSHHGKLYAWGQDPLVSLSVDSDLPKLVDALAAKHVCWVAVGDFHIAAVTEQGELYMWGAGLHGKLGHGDAENVWSPKIVDAFRGQQVVACAASQGHSAAITDLGALYTWGNGDYGQLGHGSKAVHGPDLCTPKLVEALQGSRVTVVSLGAQHSTCCTAFGELFSWGQGDRGKLGHGNTQSEAAPKLVVAFRGCFVSDVSCGADHTAAVADGVLYSWGHGAYAKTGHGHARDAFTPTVVRSLTGVQIACVSAGDNHTLAVSDSGTVYSWGKGRDGQLGYATGRDVQEPKVVASLAGKAVVCVSAGADKSVAVTDEGELFTWGLGRWFALGHGNSSSVTIPKRVAALAHESVVGVVAENAPPSFPSAPLEERGERLRPAVSAREEPTSKDVPVAAGCEPDDCAVENLIVSSSALVESSPALRVNDEMFPDIRLENYRNVVEALSYLQSQIYTSSEALCGVKKMLDEGCAVARRLERIGDVDPSESSVERTNKEVSAAGRQPQSFGKVDVLGVQVTTISGSEEMRRLQTLQRRRRAAGSSQPVEEAGLWSSGGQHRAAFVDVSSDAARFEGLAASAPLLEPAVYYPQIDALHGAQAVEVQPNEESVHARDSELPETDRSHVPEERSTLPPLGESLRSSALLLHRLEARVVCIRCKRRDRCFACLPCGHLVYCLPCARTVFAGARTCGLCAARADGMLEISFE